MSPHLRGAALPSWTPLASGQVRAWAMRYTAMGWPVTPSCAGGPRGQWQCAAPDLHPANARWVGECTTDAAVLDALWDARPGAGVIAQLGEAFGALAVDLPVPTCLALLSAGGLTVPVLHQMMPNAGGALSRPPMKRLFVLVEPIARILRLPLGVSVHHRRFLALPACDGAEGHAQWATVPDAESPHDLVPASVVASALGDLI